MMSDEQTILLTPAQSRAARALLAWSQQELARNASVATSTVADFERGQRSPVPNNLEALKSAFEKDGIRFPKGGAVAGPPTKFVSRSRVPQDRVAPIRWISETDLDNWASSRVGQDTFPELIRRLVLAEAGYHQELRFPSGDSVAMQGWDGETKINFASPIIPPGFAGWELGTDKQPKAKADQPYKDRTKSTPHSDPAQTTFVFATPRRWAKKAEWQKAKRAEGIWKDVRVIDAVDLVQWLERFPAVALWFAQQTNKVPEDVTTLEQVWREWSLSTTPPLSIPLILADRDDTAARVWQWLRDEASVLALQADAPIEARAFLHAAIEQYPVGHRDFFHSRAIVAANADTARALADVGTPLIIVVEEAEPGVNNSLVQKGHHVFIALTGDAEQGTTLQRPIRYTIEEELIQMKVPRDRATHLAHDAARSLTILRRLMPSAPGVKTPGWATASNARHMIPALLTGAWDEGKAADKRVLESLSGLPYDDFARELTAILNEPDSPLRKIGAAWKIASPRDAWFRLAAFLITADLEKFTGLAADVLGSADPRFKLEPDERWRADLSGEDAIYSDLIRTGIAEVLVLLSVFGSRASAVSNASLHAARVVKRLLGKADAERWWSLHRQLKILAEASPEEFLDAVDDSLAQTDPPIMQLLKEGGGFVFGGGGEYAHLLWALEILAWSHDYLARVTDILAKLTQLDPGGRLQNRPRETFQQIYRLWYPQTSATLDQRNAVLRRLRKTHPKMSWEYLLYLYPKSHDSATDSPVPRWRDFAVGEPERATHPVIIRGAQVIGGWLVEDVGVDAKRWQELFERYADFAPDLRKRVIEHLAATADSINNDDDRAAVQQALRKLLNHHRQFQKTAGWALPEAELQIIEDVYRRLEPKDDLLKIKWLFDDHHAPILDPHGAREWDANTKASDNARRQALADLLAKAGIQGVLRLYPMVRYPGLVGRAYAQTSNANFPAEFIEALKTNGGSQWAFAQGAIYTYREIRGDAWADTLLDQAIQEKWGDLALERILLALPKSEHFMERVAKIGGAVDAAYWAKIEVFQINVPAPAKPQAVEHLLAAKRAHATIQYAGHYAAEIPSHLLIRVLTDAVSAEPTGEPNDGTMFQFYVTTILEKLDNDSSVDKAEVARLEWSYLKLLEYSNRAPKELPKFLATSPSFFLEVLSAAYRGEHEQGLDENAPDHQTKKSMAGQAWTLLRGWSYLPGLMADGKVDGEELERWVKAARILCAGADRGPIGDQVIGQMLAHAPADNDGTWPCLPVREVIEITRSADLETGIHTGLINSRGVTTRLPTDGGAQERDLAAQYQAWSEKTRLEFPRTSALLAKIAKGYEWDAKFHDDDADLQQW